MLKAAFSVAVCILPRDLGPKFRTSALNPIKTEYSIAGRAAGPDACDDDAWAWESLEPETPSLLLTPRRDGTDTKRVHTT